MAVYDIDGNLISGGTAEIEPYYEAEMEDTVSKVKNEITEPCLVFPAPTDVHIGSDVTQTFGKMVANITKFSEEIKCDFLACLGDLIDGAYAKATSLGVAFDASEKMRAVGLPYIFAQGNHDNNVYSNAPTTDKFDMSEIFKTLFNSVRNVQVNPSENGTDYCFDMGVGVRVIVLNSCNVKRANNYAYGSSTATWLENVALDTDSTVLLLEHLSSISTQVWNNNSPTGHSGITSALTSFVNGGGNLVQLSGHSHVDLAFIAPWLSVMFICQKCIEAPTDTTGMGKITGYIDVIGSYPRTAGTASEDAWTACVLKPNSGELATIRFGAGVDRYFHYKPIAPTTLTSKLSNVAWSSSNTSVATVSNGVVTGVASGTCAVLAKDSTGNYEAWVIKVT